MMTVDLTGLVRGRRYLVLYRRQPGTPLHAAVLDYVGDNGKTLTWEGLPVLGRQQISKRWIIYVSKVSHATEIAMMSGADSRTIERVAVLLGRNESRLAERMYEVENGGM